MSSHPVTAAGAEQVSDLRAFLQTYIGNEDLWIVGGASLYQQVFDFGLAQELFLTVIDADFKCDQFFPVFEAGFEVVSKTDQQQENGFSFHYEVLKQSH